MNHCALDLLGIDKESLRVRKPYRLENYSAQARRRLEGRIASGAPAHFYKDDLFSAHRWRQGHGLPHGCIRIGSKTGLSISGTSPGKHWNIRELEKQFQLVLELEDPFSLTVRCPNPLFAVRWTLLALCDLWDLGDRELTIEHGREHLCHIESQREAAFIPDTEVLRGFNVAQEKMEEYARIQGYRRKAGALEPDACRSDVALLSDVYSDLFDAACVLHPLKVSRKNPFSLMPQHPEFASELNALGFEELASRQVPELDDYAALAAEAKERDKELRLMPYPHSYFFQPIKADGSLSESFLIWHISKDNNPNELASRIFAAVNKLFPRHEVLVDDSRKNFYEVRISSEVECHVWYENLEIRFYDRAKLKFISIGYIKFRGAGEGAPERTPGSPCAPAPGGIRI